MGPPLRSRSRRFAAVAYRLEHVITSEPAAKSKALLRLLIELPVNGRNEIQPGAGF